MMLPLGAPWYGERPMPWTVLTELERARHQARESSDRTRGACHDTVASLISQTSALLRRRSSEDIAMVSALVTDAGHCVPCISLVTNLDARRVYAALERLKQTTNVELLFRPCTRCTRLTTVHVIQP
jgi:hypothetical protein